MLDTLDLLKNIQFPAIERSRLTVLQANLGYKCNQQCLHCHVNAGPKRTEQMSRSTIAELKKFISDHNIKTLDLTGGAPELHPEFRDIVNWAYKKNIKVLDRCNLTVLFEPGQEDTVEFLVRNKVEIIASLPCYLEENVDKQRGKGVFEKSVRALQKLNHAGFGLKGSDLKLNLVYNPQGATLPPTQDTLERDYKRHLRDNYQIKFNGLMVITNLPIARFGSTLISKGEFENYMDLLKNSFEESNLENVMCKYLLSVDWQGNIYDCDFNQMLSLATMGETGKSLNINDLNNGASINDSIKVLGHCYGCTAGQGSGCSGALS